MKIYRIIFGAARNNHMPTVLAFINIKFLTPMVSVVFMVNIFRYLYYVIIGNDGPGLIRTLWSKIPN